MKAKERTKAYIRRVWKQKKMWYKKMIKAVARSIDNLEELERAEQQER